MKELLKELEVAMERNPGLSVLEVIDWVCDRHYPTRDRRYTNFLSEQETKHNFGWDLTNSDIYKALKEYNESRNR
jgi:hypothetical protein